MVGIFLFLIKDGYYGNLFIQIFYFKFYNFNIDNKNKFFINKNVFFADIFYENYYSYFIYYLWMGVLILKL